MKLKTGQGLPKLFWPGMVVGCLLLAWLLKNIVVFFTGIITAIVTYYILKKSFKHLN